MIAMALDDDGQAILSGILAEERGRWCVSLEDSGWRDRGRGPRGHLVERDDRAAVGTFFVDRRSRGCEHDVARRTRGPPCARETVSAGDVVRLTDGAGHLATARSAIFGGRLIEVAVERVALVERPAANSFSRSGRPIATACYGSRKKRQSSASRVGRPLGFAGRRACLRAGKAARFTRRSGREW